ncbi:MAG TPA: YihY/virulence factor BrkB family protein [Anaerovoracaceae bacterium]|nr:YihY/virulence factor BrkB family protein [Anaerovoracaceae bacterium]
MSVEKKFRNNKYVRIGFHIWKQFDDPYYQGFAAQLAYFFFMSSVPTIIVISQLLGVFDVSLDFLNSWIDSYVDSEVKSTLTVLFDSSSVVLTNILLIVLSLWAASSLQFGLARISNYTLTSGTYKFNFFRERIMAIPTAIFSLFAISFAIIIFIQGGNILNDFVDTVFHMNVITNFLLLLRWPLAMGLYLVMVILNYYLLPRIRVPIKSIVPGAIVASLGMLIVTVVYSFYANNISNYNIIYGSLANIVILMFWFYFISWVLIIGVMFNKAWDKIMEKHRLTPEKLKEYLKRQEGSEKDSNGNHIIDINKMEKDLEYINRNKNKTGDNYDSNNGK